MKYIDVVTKSKARSVSLEFFMTYDKNKLKLVWILYLELELVLLRHTGLYTQLARINTLKKISSKGCECLP